MCPMQEVRAEDEALALQLVGEEGIIALLTQVPSMLLISVPRRFIFASSTA